MGTNVGSYWLTLLITQYSKAFISEIMDKEGKKRIQTEKIAEVF